MKALFLIVAVVLGVAGCDKTPEPKTVQYFLEHKDEIVTRLDRCRKEKDDGQECRNANEAAGTAFATPLFGASRAKVRTLDEIAAERRAAAASTAGGDNAKK